MLNSNGNSFVYFFWFQSFGAVMGMDWHSSGITTSVLGALKRAINPHSASLGIYVCGGKGKFSKETPDELIRIAMKTGLDGNELVRYDEKGKLLGYFGGRGDEQKHLDNAHGITVDTRKAKPDLLVTDRTRNCFKRFSFDGELIEVISLPGACVCRPVISGDHLYAAVLRSPNLDSDRSGFVTILDKDNKVVSNIGGSEPAYENGRLKPMAQTDKIFAHPHDVCIDDDGNLYVAQWNSDQVYPYKFTRV